ncbi:LVIVD repeat-containing protein [Candidatus Pyrohabitans sp.]
MVKEQKMREFVLLFMILFAGCTGSTEESSSPGESMEQSTGFLDVFVDYPYAYVTSSWGVSIIDFSDFDNPRLVGSMRTTGQAEGILVKEGYAFVCDGLDGLKVINVSNPEAPAFVSAFSYRGNLKQIVARGDEAYIANFDSTDGLLVLNISSIENITLIGKFDPPGYEHVRDLFVDENYIYLADFTGGMRIVERRNLSLVATYKSRGVAYSVAVKDGIAVLADSDAGVDIINITQAEKPVKLSNINTKGYAIKVKLLGNIAFVTTGSHGLYVFDITIPAKPRLLSHYDTPGNAFGFHIDGDMLYLADFNNGLLVLDISDPISPLLVSHFLLGGESH